MEQDPRELWTSGRDVMARALQAAGCRPADVRAIGITNQRETTILWDRRSGEPLHAAIVWQSRQTAAVCERLRAAGAEADVRERTGLVIDPYFSASKIAWLLRALSGGAAARRGRRAAVRHRGHLAASGSSPAAGSTPPIPPTPAAPCSTTSTIGAGIRTYSSCSACRRPCCPWCGRAAACWTRRPPSTASRPASPSPALAGDQQAALYGQTCWEPGLAKTTYGTGAFVVLNLGQRHPVLGHGLLTTICCDAAGNPAYAVEGAIFTAGAAVQWLRDELRIVDRAADTEALAGSVPDTGGVYFVPAFNGLAAPYWDMHARGAIVGLTRGTDRRHLVRATLESLAYQTRDVIDAMRESGVEPTELRVDGGAAANGFLMQFQADILGVPVDRPAVLETTATGAALLAGLGVGFWKDPEQLRHLRRRERLFEPRMPADERDRLYAGWRRAVGRVRSGPPPGEPAAG